MNKLLFILACFLLFSFLNTALATNLDYNIISNSANTRLNSAPQVSNVTTFQRTDGSKIIDVYYDLADADDDHCTVSLVLSQNGGASYNLIPTTAYLSGDFGENITPGTGKHIIWNAGAESFYLDGQYIYRVQADDSSVQSEFVQVTTTGTPLLVGRTEVTQASYTQVMGTNPSNIITGNEYPVHNVNYLDAVKYCNARSLQEGLVPYYIWKLPCHSYPSPYGGYVWPNWPAAGECGDYFPSGGGYVYMVYMTQHMALGVEPRVFAPPVTPTHSNGYRLLTEDEWEFAAKGGLASNNYTYSGSNVADSVAWYDQNAAGAPHPVATKTPNELGIYDMSGNVQEWVYDRFRYNLPIYGLPPFTPLKWTTIGTCKGGWWSLGESTLLPDYTYQREANVQSQYVPAYPTNYTAGFRICRSMVPDQTPSPVVISPAGLTYNTPVQVTMACSSLGTFITFTTDGSEPNSGSARYTGPFTLHHSTVIKAKSFNSVGMMPSLSVSETYTIQLPPPSANDLIRVEGGEFNNGVSDITLNSFYISESEIRQADFYSLMGGNPQPGQDFGLDYPATGISWFRAIAYCNKRSIAEGLTPCYAYGSSGTNTDTWPAGWDSEGNQANITVNWYSANGYRLPTEMEWMFAARGGNLSHDYLYSGSNTPSGVAWYDANSGNTPHQTNTLSANELGLYDMSGNVWEWCWDYQAPSYPAGSQTNPTGPDTGVYRIVRGGSFNVSAEECLMEHRAWLPTSNNTNTTGFRVCRQIAPTSALGEVQFSLPPGSYGEMIEVDLGNPDPQAMMRFTLNGSTPTAYYGTVYDPAQPIRLYSDVTIKAVAYHPGYLVSAVSEAVYTFANSQPEGFVFAEGGSFSNGTSAVQVSGFFIDNTEITQADYQAVMSANPSSGYGVGAAYPVYNVSWFSAVEYCNRRSILEGLQPCYTYLAYGSNPDNWPSGWNSEANHANISSDINNNGYRLPTEAEWMYAARGGRYSQNYTYCGSNAADSVSWYAGNSAGTNHPTGSLNPNELGLYDMGGNIWEWCWDIYAAYPAESQDNPSGPVSGVNRLVRGGSKDSPAEHCTPALRNNAGPANLAHNLGFRVCRSAIDTYSPLGLPVFTPGEGFYESAINVFLFGSAPGTRFRYTTDGTEPSATVGTLYSAPVYLYTNTTLKAVALHGGYNPSPVLTAEYAVVDTPPAPVFSPQPGNFEIACLVTLACPAPFTQIRYTTDDTEPTSTYGTLYTAPFRIDQTTTVKAISFRESSPSSLVALAVFTIDGLLPADLCLVGGGTFHNGTSNVTVSNFYIGTNEVTQAMYISVMGTNPASGNGTGSEYPVYNTTWFNAVEYCNRRSLSECLTPAYSYNNGTDYGTDPANWPAGWYQADANQNNISANRTANGYRLPTEMEWMFTARGGTLTHGYTYCGGNGVDSLSWYSANAGSTTHPAAQLQPNELGLYDMGGNVWEWCWDFFADTYPSGDQTDPAGPASGQYRLLRGGCTASPAEQCTPVFRNTIWPTFVTTNVGFRICRTAPATLTASTPVFNHPGGLYHGSITVTVSSATPGAAIRYTTDGTEPSATLGTEYITPLVISQDVTLKAVAFRAGYNDSPVAEVTYAITDSVPEGFVYAEGGTFHNGTSNVTISRFFIERKEVTQASYAAMMGTNPSAGYGTGSEYPVYYTTWFNAVEYCNRRSIADGLTPVYSYNNGTAYGTNPANWPAGWNLLDANQNYISANWAAKGYRLPTEMEWMFAARGGNLSQNYTYCGGNDINTLSWYDTNSGNSNHPTAQLQANELGLYDMGGNVWEWCWDFYAAIYPSGDQTDPTGPPTGQYRLLRGGSAFSPGNQCNPVFRNTIWPTFNNQTLGLRVVRNTKE